MKSLLKIMCLGLFFSCSQFQLQPMDNENLQEFQNRLPASDFFDSTKTKTESNKLREPRRL